MGRKSKRKTSGTSDETSRSDRKDILRLCGQIIDLSATQCPPTPAEQYEEFLQINSLVEKIRKKQHDGHLHEGDRDTHFEEFFTWLNVHGVPTQDFKICQFEEGYGLQATRDVKMDEELMCIPRKLMISDQDAINSSLGELIRGDRLLKGMPNVSLAVFLISEKLRPDSFWKPYLDILPSSYTIPLYYSPAELKLLQGSPAYGEALKQHKNIARQYAYLYKVLNQPDYSKLQLRDHFTYDLYRWAVSTVMSRQNQIPSKDQMGVSLALIPLWDMCNHTNGEMKTDFDQERDACINLAMRDFSAGDQLYLCYGRRTNADLLLYSGFVHPNNEHDGINIQLGLSSGDRLYAMKAQLCAVMRLAVPSQSYNLSSGADPVSLELLTFLRIFCMNEDELKERLMGEERKQLLFKLVYKNQIISKLNELRICVYLATRITLLLRLYKTSILEDEEKLNDPKLSFKERCATQLLLSEKQILESALNHCALWRERAENLEEGAISYTPARKGEEEETAETWEEREEADQEEEKKALLNGGQNGHGGSSPGDVEENGDADDEVADKEDGEIPKVNGDVDDEVADKEDGEMPKVNGDADDEVAVKEDGEMPKVNGDVVKENGNHDDKEVIVAMDKQAADDSEDKSEGTIGDINDNVDAPKAKVNGSIVNGGTKVNGNGVSKVNGIGVGKLNGNGVANLNGNGDMGHQLLKGNGAVTEGQVENRTDGLKHGNTSVDKSKSGTANGHISVAPVTEE